MYLTTTTSTEAIEFEGRVWHNTAMVATMQEMERQVLDTNAPPADDPTTVSYLIIGNAGINNRNDSIN